MGGIDPERLAVCLEVLRELDELDPDHPDAIALRRATAHVYKSVKQRRRSIKRASVTAADEAVTNLTATGAADRIDDETRGVLLEARHEGVVGSLQRARACYLCKARYVEVDAFYHQLCPSCAAFSWAKREQRVDLTGRRALLTGGRAKIGMYIALMLLRDGASLTITTRFPHDAVRRFQGMPDAADWLDRLRVVGIDLRDPHQVVELPEHLEAHREALRIDPTHASIVLAENARNPVVGCRCNRLALRTCLVAAGCSSSSWGSSGASRTS
jgi:hypothetical protein